MKFECLRVKELRKNNHSPTGGGGILIAVHRKTSRCTEKVNLGTTDIETRKNRHFTQRLYSEASSKMSEAKKREPETPTILQPGLDEVQKAISEPPGKSRCLRYYFTTALLENREQTRNHLEHPRKQTSKTRRQTRWHRLACLVTPRFQTKDSAENRTRSRKHRQTLGHTEISKQRTLLRLGAPTRTRKL